MASNQLQPLRRSQPARKREIEGADQFPSLPHYPWSTDQAERRVKVPITSWRSIAQTESDPFPRAIGPGNSFEPTPISSRRLSTTNHQRNLHPQLANRLSEAKHQSVQRRGLLFTERPSLPVQEAKDADYPSPPSPLLTTADVPRWVSRPPSIEPTVESYRRPDQSPPVRFP